MGPSYAELAQTGYRDLPQLEPRAYLSGLDYSPLPYESTPSVIARLAYCNVIDTDQGLKEAFGYRWCPSTFNFPNGVRLLASQFKEATGWPAPREESLALQVAPKLQKWLFSTRFRFCPVCLKCGYHSFWYQLQGLTRCPLHSIPIQTTCRYCGKTVGRYGQAVRNSSGFWACQNCGAPMSDEPFSLMRHTVFRKNVAQLDAFLPYQCWYSTGNRELSLVEQVIAQNNLNGWSWWCDPGAFLLQASRKIAPGPLNRDDGGSAQDVTALRWKIRMTATQHLSETPVQRAGIPQLYLRRVYASTVTILHRWVFGGTNGVQCARDMISVMQTGTIPTAGHTAKQIAFAFFRACFEYNPTNVFGWIDPRAAQIREPFATRYLGRCIQRLPLRAVLLASFAILLRYVTDQMTCGGLISLLGVGTRLQAGIPLIYLPAYAPGFLDSDYSEGIVMFPAIEDLDIRRVWPGEVL